MKAIPTVYRGQQYRSMLEARWACFFDIIGWSVHNASPFWSEWLLQEFGSSEANPNRIVKDAWIQAGRTTRWSGGRTGAGSTESGSTFGRARALGVLR